MKGHKGWFGRIKRRWIVLGTLVLQAMRTVSPGRTGSSVLGAVTNRVGVRTTVIVPFAHSVTGAVDC